MGLGEAFAVLLPVFFGVSGHRGPEIGDSQISKEGLMLCDNFTDKLL